MTIAGKEDIDDMPARVVRSEAVSLKNTRVEQDESMNVDNSLSLLCFYFVDLSSVVASHLVARSCSG